MPVSMGSYPRHLEELRLGGGYNSAPDGGTDLDAFGNIQSNGGLDLDGQGNIGGNLHVGGDLEVDGLNSTWATYLPAHLGMPDPALPCGAVTPTNWRNYQVATPSLAFDPDAAQAAYFQFRLPKAYDGRPLKFTLEWSATAGTAGDVRWGVNPITFGDAISLVEIGTLQYFVDSFVGVSVYHEVSTTSSSLSADNEYFVTLRVIRDASNILDTFNGTALLLGVEIAF